MRLSCSPQQADLLCWDCQCHYPPCGPVGDAHHEGSQPGLGDEVDGLVLRVVWVVICARFSWNIEIIDVFISVITNNILWIFKTCIAPPQHHCLTKYWPKYFVYWSLNSDKCSRQLYCLSVCRLLPTFPCSTLSVCWTCLLCWRDGWLNLTVGKSFHGSRPLL